MVSLSDSSAIISRRDSHPGAIGSVPPKAADAPKLILHRPPAFEIPISLVYRTNLTSERLLTKVDADLRTLGYKVYRYPIPAEFSGEQVTDMIREFGDSIAKTICFTDQTALKNWPKNGPTLYRDFLGKIDSILYSATFNSIAESDGGGPFGLSRESCWHRESPDGYKKFQERALSAMQRVLARALKDKPVDLITIFPAHLNDHIPFFYGPERVDSGAILREAFEQMGFASSVITVCEDLRKFDVDRLFDSKFSVSIGDRHILTTSLLDNQLKDLVRGYVQRDLIRPDSNRSGKSRRDNPIREMLAEECLVHDGVRMFREILGIDPALIEDDPDNGKRYWLRLPLEELYGSVLQQGLVSVGDFEDQETLAAHILNNFVTVLESI